MPADDQLRIRINSGPSINISATKTTLGGRQVLLLTLNEAPDFVALDSLAAEAP
jgi:hypothetical protein